MLFSPVAEDMRFVIPLLIAFLTTTAFAETSRPEAKKTPAPLVLPERQSLPGKRFNLPLGELFVPHFYNAELTTGTEVCVFFLGAAWVTQQNYDSARKNAPLVTIGFPTLGEYGPAFKSPKAFRDVLDSVQAKLVEENFTTRPITKVCLASFSGGYSAVREILSQREYADLVTDVLLADSLYPARTKDKPPKIDPASAKAFTDFALKAAAGEKTMWYTQLFPPKPHERGNTTTMAADFLIDAVGAERKWFLGAGPDSAPTTETLHNDYAATRNAAERAVLYRADKGNFHVIGYAGMTMQDHMEHLYRVHELFEKSTLTPAP